MFTEQSYQLSKNRGFQSPVEQSSESWEGWYCDKCGEKKTHDGPNKWLCRHCGHTSATLGDGGVDEEMREERNFGRCMDSGYKVNL